MNPLFEAFRSAAGLSGAGDRCRILIVEDNIDLARVIAMLLRHCGFEVKTAHDGRLVLAIARAFRPRFILLDIGLPGMDGYQVGEQLRADAEFQDTTIIALSAYGPEMHPGRSLKARFDHYLTKPVALEDLLPLLVSR